jgi:hypothetical protein
VVLAVLAEPEVQAEQVDLVVQAVLPAQLVQAVLAVQADLVVVAVVVVAVDTPTVKELCRCMERVVVVVLAFLEAQEAHLMGVFLQTLAPVLQMLVELEELLVTEHQDQVAMVVI